MRKAARQQKSELNADDFANGVNDAICALRSVYSGVRTMLAELTAELLEPPKELYQLPVAVKSVTTRESPDEKVLRSWFGAFYTDKDYPKRPQEQGIVNLTVGQALVFVKVVLLSEDSLRESEPPHLLFGEIRNCRISKSTGKTLTVNKAHFRRILDDLDKSRPKGDFESKAIAGGWKEKKEKQERRLIFTLDRPPTVCSLFEIRGRDKIREIAEQIKALHVS